MGCGASSEPASKEKAPPLTCTLSKEELAEKGWHKEILEPGTIPLKKGSKIIVNFKGYLRDPPYTCFGEGTDKQITVGKGLVKGMNKGIAEMKSGETAIIACSAAYGYGEKSMPGVPADSELLFKVTVHE
eukprot:TRINITY_DN8164_c0_g1_i1.p1 TRINITY_DN8164_c0_g1~~TRINITY_DN8164_c0_g1_i1.p1  ORF type:complete len:130 (+),score=21.15 TRINITY_DN8164_c0_g1_i1:57-446(+)